MKKTRAWLQKLLFDVDFSEAVDDAFRDYARITGSRQPPEPIQDAVSHGMEAKSLQPLETQRTIPPPFFGVVIPAK